MLVDLPMPWTRARRYSIEIKDAGGSIVFSGLACWDDKDNRLALAQITNLAQLPAVNFYTGPARELDSGNSKRQPKPGTGRIRREPC
jgi:hypothetical protein